MLRSAFEYQFTSGVVGACLQKMNPSIGWEPLPVVDLIVPGDYGEQASERRRRWVNQ